jgi:hypothetical protein
MKPSKIITFIFALLVSVLTTTAQANTTSEPLKAQMIKEFPLIKGAVKLIGGSAERLFFRMKDGAVVMTDLEGKLLKTLQAKDDGDLVLQRPESVTVGNEWIYVADSELHQVVMFSLDGKFEKRFGAKKSGFFSSAGAEGALNKPVALAYHEGIVYVLDREAKNILLFGSNGVFLNNLAIKPSTNTALTKAQAEQFSLRDPSKIQLDVTGRIYVLDAEVALVKEYLTSGEFVHSLPWDGELLDLAVAQDGLYTVKRNDLSIQKYDFNKVLLYQFAGSGNAPTQVTEISGIASVKNRQLVIADTKKGVVKIFVGDAGIPVEIIPRAASRIFIESVDQIPLSVKKMVWDRKDSLFAIDAADDAIVQIRNGKVVGTKIKSPDIHPVALAVDYSGALWVLDKKYRVLKLDSTGNILFSFGSEGSGDGQFDEPTDMVISASGKFYISDQGNGTIQVFDKKGTLLNIIKGLKKPIALAVDQQEALFVLEKGNSFISMFSDRGTRIGAIGQGPEKALATLIKPLALMANLAEISVIDGNIVKVYSNKGAFLRSFASSGSQLGELDEPISIICKDEVGFFIAEAGNKRIQSFVTQYKPLAPENLAAKGDLHQIELSWDAFGLPYIAKYIVYRSKAENSGYVKIASVPTPHFIDMGLEPDGQYYYRIAAETELGYEGASSPAVKASALKYTPPVLAAIEVKTTPWKVYLTWQAIESPFVTSYTVFRKDGNALVKIGDSLVASFTDTGLTPSRKYTYAISAHSSDGTDAPIFTVEASTLPFSKAPLEIEVVKLKPIFSNTYKLYEEEGVGTVRLTNNTDQVMEGITFSFLLKDFMDFPTESKIEQLLPSKSIEVQLRAVFNNKVLTITEDTSVQAMLEASFFDNGRRESFPKTATVSVYEKHKLLWDERGRYASFITPKDPPLMAFVRSVVTQYKTIKDDSQLAAVLFNALGVYGLTYLPDPANPYQVISGKTNVVDYIQFPRETLERKSGDCDDLVAFYTSALESLGIATRVIEVPGHMFMMFSTGLKVEADNYTMDNMYVAYEGQLWIPVETTAVGSSFIKAWELGAKKYYEYLGKGLTILNIAHEWETYKPASLAESNWRPSEVTPAMVEFRFPHEVGSMLKMISQAKTRKYLQAIKANPADVDAHLQVGIVLAKMGDREQALKYFDKVISLQPENAAALNNRGNLMMMNDNPAEAQKSYLAAAEHSPQDPYVWINLAKAYRALKQITEATEAFQKAVALNAAIKTEFKALGLELSNTL